jgi:DNA-binding CsgD family transcriptional regulator
MLPASYSSLLQSRTREEFRTEVVRTAQRLGFDTVTAMTVVDHTPGSSEFIVVDNTPTGYKTTFNSAGAQQRDPVMRHCKEESAPIVWTRNTYSLNSADDLWEEQEVFGYRNGIALALHLPDRHHFMLGVDRHSPLPEDPREVQRLVSDIQLFTVYALDAAMRVLVPRPLQPDRPGLTPREVEVLRWTMEGKTAWEVGKILSITERTAVLHIGNAMRKLDCPNKHLAVLKALRLGLIH